MHLPLFELAVASVFAVVGLGFFFLPEAFVRRVRGLVLLASPSPVVAAGLVLLRPELVKTAPTLFAFLLASSPIASVVLCGLGARLTVLARRDGLKPTAAVLATVVAALPAMGLVLELVREFLNDAP